MPTSSSSPSSSVPPSSASSREDTALLDRIRHLRLPQPPSTGTAEQAVPEVAHLGHHAATVSLPPPVAAPEPVRTTTVAVPVPPLATADAMGMVAPPALTVPSGVPRLVPAVDAVALTRAPVRATPASSASTTSLSMSLPVLPLVAPSHSAHQGSIPGSAVTASVGSTSSSGSPHSAAPPLVHSTLPLAEAEDGGDVHGTTPPSGLVARAPPELPALPVAPAPLPGTVAARLPALTVTVLTEPPPGSVYPTTPAAQSCAPSAPRQPTAAPSPAPTPAAGPTVELVAVKRQKKPLEGRDVHLFRESASDASDEEPSPRPPSANDLFAFLGNIVSTADPQTTTQRGATHPSASRAPGGDKAEAEKKKRRKRLAQELAQPPLVVRHADVRPTPDSATPPEEKEAVVGGPSEERSMSSQSTNALTPDQKAKRVESSPDGATAEKTPEKTPCVVSQTQPLPRRTHSHHRRRHTETGHDDEREGFPSTTAPQRTGSPRHWRAQREPDDERDSLDDGGADILIDAPAAEDSAREGLADTAWCVPKGAEPAVPRASTFVRQLAQTYGDVSWTRAPALHVDPRKVRLSDTTELTRRGFCKSGAFDGDMSSATLPSMSQRDVGAAPARPKSPPPPAPLPECLYVTIHGMGPMHADVNVVHPFARVWLMNGRTGENLVSARNGAPFAITHLFDMRQRQARAPSWEAELALPLNRASLRKAPKETLLLVEVLDICTETITGEFVPRSGMYPICWGYYYLYDRFGNINLGVTTADESAPDSAAHASVPPLHLQMFRFPLRTPWYTQLFSSVLPPFWASPAVWAPFDYLTSGGVLQTGGQSIAVDEEAETGPSTTHTRAGVYAIFRSMRTRKIPYKAGLSVSLRFVQNEANPPTRVASATEYEEHLLRQLAAMAGNCLVPRLHDTPHGRSSMVSPTNEPLRVPSPRRVSEEVHRMSLCVVDTEALAQTYERVGTAERCLPPTQTVQTCPVAGALTCMTFSRAGTLLALGVTRHLQYVVELRLPLLADFPVVARLDAHTAHIYHVAFNSDDSKLLSCASDNTVRIWMGTDGYNFADVSPQVRTLNVSCVCVLPHRWPMYTATFHSFQPHRRRHNTDEYVITGGYSNKIVTWRLCDAPHFRNQHSASNSFVTAGRGLLGSTALSDSDGRQTCELVSRVTVRENAFVLELASTNGSNRVWSIDSAGIVTCWRATMESDGFDMSVRMRSSELPCTRILVSPSTVVAFKPNSAAVYLFDATSGKALRSKPPPIATDCAAFTVLPDGSGFVGGTAKGRLRCWNWETTTLFSCTGHQGYRGTEVAYPIDRIAWASGEHLVATASPAPCPECYLNDILLPPMRPPDELGALPLPPFDLSQLEVTLITIAGAPQPGANMAPPTTRLVDFVRLFGGDATALQRARTAQSQRQASSGQHTSVLVERFEEEDVEDPATVLSRAMAQVDAQLNSIVQFWRRAFAGTETTRADGTSSSADRYRAADADS